jgi:hypothetical protein
MFQTQGRMMEQAEEDDNSKESEASEKSIDRAGDVLLVLGTDTLRVCAEFSVTYFVPFFFFFFFNSNLWPPCKCIHARSAGLFAMVLMRRHTPSTGSRNY